MLLWKENREQIGTQEKQIYKRNKIADKTSKNKIVYIYLKSNSDKVRSIIIKNVKHAIKHVLRRITTKKRNTFYIA